ncbi:MAG: hypothetical protein HRT65_12480 [Flavobacteriaceae bacterium]|nr:hypothetical protein [Flavobacteriaceae bacterium]
MKKFFSFLAIITLIAVSNCTQVPENDDPVLGIWAKSAIAAQDTNEREEWIFNDAFLGRYQRYVDNELTFYTDFSWSETDGMYTVTYKGTDIPTASIVLNAQEKIEQLEYTNGEVFAYRE